MRVARLKVRMAEQQGTQATRSLCDQLQITAAELQTRLAFLSFGEQDGRNLVEIRDVISSRVDELIGEFYDHLLQFEELRGILSDPKLVERLKGSQRQYLLSLGQLGDGVEYAEARLRIGLTHERVGLKQKWYLGAYHKLFELILQRLAVRYSGDVCRLSSLVLTLNKIITLDEIFVVETYYHATMQRLEDSLHRLKDAHRQLEDLSRRDSLTPVNNRRALMEAEWTHNHYTTWENATELRPMIDDPASDSQIARLKQDSARTISTTFLSLFPRWPSSVGLLGFSTKRLRASPPPKPTPNRTSKTPVLCLKATCKPSSPNAATAGWRSRWQSCATSNMVSPSRVSSSHPKAITFS